jgi:hypothetical protein
MDPTHNKRVSQMIQVQQDALELFKKKNADYGDAFAKFGVIGVLMRIEDKIQRSLSISKNGITLVGDEKIRNTLIDLHNYAAMAIMLLDEDTTTFSSPLSNHYTIQPILKS